MSRGLATAGRILPRTFFERPTAIVARELLGRILVVRQGRSCISGRIVETEAYLGREDAASHAARGPTPRAAIMYGPPGRLYVYFTYGTHHCINVVTERDGIAGAVLVRALQPLSGTRTMAGRRGVLDVAEMASGPGKLALALGIDRTWNGEPLTRGRITVREGHPLPEERVSRSPRVGIRLARELPLRFAELHSPYVSRPWPWRRRAVTPADGG